MTAQTTAAMPLLLAEPGETFRVAAFLHGLPPEPQLAKAGIAPGATLTLLSIGEEGAVVAKNGTRLALGRAAAQKILVAPIPEEI